MTPQEFTHSKPCKECPWRRNSPRGFLGGNPTEAYADAQRVCSPIACHLAEHSYCAGALISLSNSHTRPRNPEHAEIVDRVRPSKTVFSHWTEFVLHHEDALEKPLPKEDRERYKKAVQFFNK